MGNLKIGDIVGRKSYGGDVFFRIVDVINNDKPVYVLKGLMHRLEADSTEDDLVKQDRLHTYVRVRQELIKNNREVRSTNSMSLANFFMWLRTKPGKILHIDSDADFKDRCVKYYREANLSPVSAVAAESKQPQMIRSLLSKHRPDIIVITGHDGLRKESSNKNSVESYWNSKYYIQSAREARKHEPDPDRLCIFSGACQSYFEAIMEAGANFASSPGRILINALDPAIVARKIAMTNKEIVVTPSEIAKLTITGKDGVGGINTRGQLVN